MDHNKTAEKLMLGVQILINIKKRNEEEKLIIEGYLKDVMDYLEEEKKKEEKLDNPEDVDERDEEKEATLDEEDWREEVESKLSKTKTEEAIEKMRASLEGLRTERVLGKSHDMVIVDEVGDSKSFKEVYKSIRKGPMKKSLDPSGVVAPKKEATTAEFVDIVGDEKGKTLGGDSADKYLPPEHVGSVGGAGISAEGAPIKDGKFWCTVCEEWHNADGSAITDGTEKIKPVV